MKKAPPCTPTTFYYLESTINEICTVSFHANQVCNSEIVCVSFKNGCT